MRRPLILLAALALLMSACGGDDDTGSETTTTATPGTTTPAVETTAAPPDTTQAPVETTAPTQETTSTAAETTTSATASGPALAVATTDLGDIIVDADGNTLYIFLPDDQGESTCYDQCAETWPPLAEGVTAGDGVDASLIASTPRTDGSAQTTYNGWPLYYYAADLAPGDTNGQGVNEIWFVIDAAGESIQ